MKAAAHDCPICGVEMTDDARRTTSKELDHIIPLVAGGAHTRDNARIVCKSCNAARPLDLSDVDGASLLMFAVSVPPRLCGCGAMLTHSSRKVCSACRILESEAREFARWERLAQEWLAPAPKRRRVGRGALRGYEIQKMRADGLGYKRIARELGLNRHDVRDYLRRGKLVVA